jgi:membrane-associated phospholipid phosphatase
MVKKIGGFIKPPFLNLLLIIGLFLSFFFDRQTTLEVSEHEFTPLRNLANNITDVALGSYWISGSIVLILLVTLLERYCRSPLQKQRYSNIRLWASHLLLAILSTGVIVMLIKFTVGRERPLIWHNQVHTFSTNPFNLNEFYQSFPSGHTQVIFCVGIMLALLWPKRRLEFLLVALIIALTRVLIMRHFISDVYVGMLIGIFGSRASVNFWSKWINKPTPWTTD